MIHNHDKFYYTDLFQSIDEIMSMDLKGLIKGPVEFLLPDDKFYNLKKVGPTEYANIMINTYNIDSSAHYLDKQLKDKGFRTTFRFAYKYKLPEEMRERILIDAYRFQWYYNLYSNPVFSSKHNQKKALPIFDDAARVSYYYAQYIWLLNPECAFDYPHRLKMYTDWEKIIHFLIGTAFEFHPKDVYAHITDFSEDSKKQKERRAFYNWCLEKHGIDTGCLILSDEHIEKLRKILTKTDTPYPLQLAQKYIKIFTK